MHFGGSCHLRGGAVSLARGGGRYIPGKTAKILELPSTPDNFVRPEESIEDMPLSPRGCGVDDNLNIDGHNEVDVRSHGCSYLLALSARRFHIMILDEF